MKLLFSYRINNRRWNRTTVYFYKIEGGFEVHRETPSITGGVYKDIKKFGPWLTAENC